MANDLFLLDIEEIAPPHIDEVIDWMTYRKGVVSGEQSALDVVEETVRNQDLEEEGHFLGEVERW